MSRLARFLRRALDHEAGAFGQTGAYGKNRMLDDVADRLFGNRWKLRP